MRALWKALSPERQALQWPFPVQQLLLQKERPSKFILGVGFMQLSHPCCGLPAQQPPCQASQWQSVFPAFSSCCQRKAKDANLYLYLSQSFLGSPRGQESHLQNLAQCMSLLLSFFPLFLFYSLVQLFLHSFFLLDLFSWKVIHRLLQCNVSKYLFSCLFLQLLLSRTRLGVTCCLCRL